MKNSLFHIKKSGANISECGLYRFKLWRIWDEEKPKVLFVMHNPSKADWYNDDPTIRRCIGFAKSWGCGGLYVGNLSPYRATNPKDMLKVDFCALFPLENIRHINEMKRLCQIHVLAYGNPIIKDSIPEFIDKDWYCISMTKQGNPGHPLFLRSDLRPKPIDKDIQQKTSIKNRQ